MKLCKKCNKEFNPSIKKPDDKWTNSSNRRYCYECSPWGKKNTKHLADYDEANNKKRCTKCSLFLPYTEEYFSARKRRPDLYPVCKECKSKIATNRAQRFKKQCLDYIGKKCVVCGYDKYMGAMHFHHLDPAGKDTKISSLQVKEINNDVKIELDKCITVCSRCHDEIHGGLHPKYLDSK